MIKARLTMENGSPEDAGNVAEVLAEAGFKVTSVSSRGISFEGAKKDFQQYFGQKLREGEKGTTFAAEPEMPGPLASLKANVYFPAKPEFFP